LVLEDLHWADPDTVALLNYLGGALKTSSVVVAATVREDSPGAAVVGGLARIPDAIHLRLGPLDYADADLLVAERHPGLDQAQRMLVIGRAEGVPLVIEELLAGTTVSAGRMAAAVPDSFAEVVITRLHGLSQEHRRVLTAAALVGGDPDWSLAAAVSDLGEPSALAAARAATDVHLLVAEDDRLRWRHALTREAVVATLLPPERSALAVRAAHALQDRGGDEDESAAADLLASAGDRDAAAEIGLRQVARDIKKGALRSAEQLLDQLAGEGSLPVQVAITRVHLYTLTGNATRALEIRGTRFHNRQ
jgi:predicted ATPase